MESDCGVWFVGFVSSSYGNLSPKKVCNLAADLESFANFAVRVPQDGPYIGFSSGVPLGLAIISPRALKPKPLNP